MKFHTIRGNEDGSFQHDVCLIEVDLFEKEENEEMHNGNPFYKIHPILRSKIDVALVDLTKISIENPEVNFVYYDLDVEDKDVE